MPTRFIQKNIQIPLDNFYDDNLANQGGWRDGSSEDIASMSWDDTAKTLTVYKVQERNLTRYIVFTLTEVFNMVSTHPGWGTGTEADIKTVYLDSASRKMVVCKLSEVG